MTRRPPVRDYNAMTPAEYKAWESRMRRRLEGQGMTLRRSRTREPRAVDYGLYSINDTATNVSISYGHTLDCDAVEAWAGGNDAA